jgi:hypothetical protein
MKKLFTLLMLACTMSVSAQNIQLHYDFGRNFYSDQESSRQKMTMTIEQFKADQWGSWFYFVDLDFSRHFVEGAYTEVSREINIKKESPFAVHVEYDGGLTRNYAFQQAALLGAAYNGHSADFSKTWSVQLLYKQYFSNEDIHSYASAQLTGVWGLNFLNNKLRFSGFIDFWRGENSNNGHGMLVMLTEPQLWYNINDHLSVGTEIEVSNNFITNFYDGKTFFVNPTLGVKWNL